MNTDQLGVLRRTGRWQIDRRRYETRIGIWYLFNTKYNQYVHCPVLN